jgi:plasmid stabilization system protein ParE
LRDPGRRVYPLRKSLSQAIQQKGRSRCVSPVRQAGDILSAYPNVGTPVSARGDVRRFVTPPYIVDYAIHPAELVILMIRHGRQLPPDPDTEDDLGDID